MSSPLFVTKPKAPGLPYTAAYYTEAPGIRLDELDQLPVALKPYLVDLTIDQTAADGPAPAHLRNLIIIDSTLSGTKTSSSLYFSVLQPLLKAVGLQHVYVSTTSSSTISEHAKSFSSPSTVIFLSGDTSIHEFVNSLDKVPHHPSLNIGVIPTGTGNALSGSIGHQDIPHAISRLFLGKAEPLSSFRVEFPKNSVFYVPGPDGKQQSVPPSFQSLVVLSWGFHASIVADSDTPEYRKLGRQRFSEAAENNLARDQLYRASISSTNQPVISTTDHSYLLFTLLTNLEKTFKISPKGRPPSAKDLYLVEMPHIPGPEILEIMMKVYDNAKHIEDERVTYKNLGSGSDPDQPLVEIKILPQKGDDLDVTRRWCVDGRIVLVEPSYDDDTVRLYPAGYHYNGWKLNIIQ